MKRLARVLLLCLIPFAVWAGNEFRVIPLKHRFGEELLPVLQPLAGPGGIVTASGNNLFIEVEPARWPAIEQALAQLDVPVRTFQIRLDRSGRHSSASSGVDVQGRIGNEVRIERTRPHRNNSGVQVQIDSHATTTRTRSSEYLRVTEGAPAFIAVGLSVPFTETWVVLLQRYGQVRQTVQYRDIVTGFSVVPRQIGDEVELAITPRISALNGDIIDFETLSTQVRVIPGTWVNLGGTLHERDDVSRTILGVGQGAQAGSGELWVLVEEK